MYDICLPTGGRERRVLEVHTLSAAEALERQRRGEIFGGERQVQPVFEIVPGFEDFCRSTALPMWASLKSYQHYYVRVVDSLIRAFGNLSLLDLTEDRIVAFKNKRLGCCTAWTVHHELRILRAILAQAVRLRRLAVHPMEAVRQPEKGIPSDAVLPVDAQRRLMATITKPLVYFVAALLRTGRRPCELQDAVVKDYHPQGSSLSFRIGKRNRLATRPLFPDADRLIAYLCGGKKPTDRIFQNEKGGRWEQWHWNNRREFHLAQEMVGVEKTVPFYRLRHTFAGDFLNAGGSIKVLSWLLCHSSVQTTERYYAHLRQDGAEEDMRIVFENQKNRACGTVTALAILPAVAGTVAVDGETG